MTCTRLYVRGTCLQATQVRLARVEEELRMSQHRSQREEGERWKGSETDLKQGNRQTPGRRSGEDAIAVKRLLLQCSPKSTQGSEDEASQDSQPGGRSARRAEGSFSQSWSPVPREDHKRPALSPTVSNGTPLARPDSEVSRDEDLAAPHVIPCQLVMRT